MTIRVLIADDQPLIREALRMLIDASPDMSVVAEASTGVEAVVRCRTHSADVVVMDNQMPDLCGVDASRQITTDPTLAPAGILLYTVFVTDELVTAATLAGVHAVLPKGVRPAELLETIRGIAAETNRRPPPTRWCFAGTDADSRLGP